MSADSRLMGFYESNRGFEVMEQNNICRYGWEEISEEEYLAQRAFIIDARVLRAVARLKLATAGYLTLPYKE